MQADDADLRLRWCDRYGLFGVTFTALLTPRAGARLACDSRHEKRPRPRKTAGMTE